MVTPPGHTALFKSFRRHYCTPLICIAAVRIAAVMFAQQPIFPLCLALCLCGDSESELCTTAVLVHGHQSIYCSCDGDCDGAASAVRDGPFGNGADLLCRTRVERSSHFGPHHTT